MTTFDFRPGRSGWGSAMHGSTFRAIKPRIVKRGRFKKPLEVPRVTVMVHCYKPEIGDKVIYQGQKGADQTLVISDIEYCNNVEDMYTLTLEPLSLETNQ